MAGAPQPGDGSTQDDYWPLPKFYFSVDIGSFTDLPFMEVTGLEIETEVVEYRHGNSPRFSNIKMPGMMKHGNVTLKKGMFNQDNQFFLWINSINLNTYTRDTVVIRLLNETGTAEFTWTLNNAFPVQINSTDMSSSASEAAVESIVFAFESIEITDS
tara:strand:- start:486 stop:959 length:474 start_codon:yes stop_codon:yes gene_type:complete